MLLDRWVQEAALRHHLRSSPLHRPRDLEDLSFEDFMACVCELRVACFERQAWIDAVLANPSGPAPQAYLELRLDEDA